MKNKEIHEDAEQDDLEKQKHFWVFWISLTRLVAGIILLVSAYTEGRYEPHPGRPYYMAVANLFELAFYLIGGIFLITALVDLISESKKPVSSVEWMGKFLTTIAIFLSVYGLSIVASGFVYLDRYKDSRLLLWLPPVISGTILIGIGITLWVKREDVVKQKPDAIRLALVAVLIGVTTAVIGSTIGTVVIKLNPTYWVNVADYINLGFPFAAILPLMLIVFLLRSITPQEDTVTFKKTNFYSILVVFAFAIGIFVGYVAWGFNTTAPASSLPPVVITAPSVPTIIPTPVIYEIPTEGFPSLGPADAPITIVEFSDYQCPYCTRWHEQTYKALMDAYPGKIRFVYRNFPLPFHQNALLSAQAALCAGDQNSYWQYHDKLFVEKNLVNDQTGAVLGVDSYVKFAGDLSLDTKTFEECLTSEKYKQFVADDANSAANLPPENGEPAVGGTPTFFINGHRLVGAVPLNYFQQIIDPELAR